jgi:hypothetical protein
VAAVTTGERSNNIEHGAKSQVASRRVEDENDDRGWNYCFRQRQMCKSMTGHGGCNGTDRHARSQIRLTGYFLFVRFHLSSRVRVIRGRSRTPR